MRTLPPMPRRRLKADMQAMFDDVMKDILGTTSHFHALDK